MFKIFKSKIRHKVLWIEIGYYNGKGKAIIKMNVLFNTVFSKLMHLKLVIYSNSHFVSSNIFIIIILVTGSKSNSRESDIFLFVKNNNK